MPVTDDNETIGRRHIPPVPALHHMPWTDAALRLEDLWRHLVDDFSGKPGLHGSTHLEGTDNVLAETLPVPLTPGSPGSIGTSASGASRGDHSHPALGVPTLADLQAALDAAGSDFEAQLRMSNELLLLILCELQAMRVEEMG